MTHEHGGNISQIENILDFSANINPLGVPESVKVAVRDNLGSIEKYPDPYCAELRSRLAIHEKMPAENIICGSGADDLIFRIVHALRPRRALICAPTFSESGSCRPFLPAGISRAAAAWSGQYPPDGRRHAVHRDD